MNRNYHIPPAPEIEALDCRILSDQSFKEDSVREEIIAPLLRQLGFSTFGQFTVKRSTPLIHPYVSIGSKKRKINIYPDYLLRYGDASVLVALDAKDPSEDITNPDHLSQAYTYAVHREVKASYYGLCNGHQLVLYRTADMGQSPYFECDLLNLKASWQTLFMTLNPISLAEDISEKLKKDFGLHLQAMGFTEKISNTFLDVPFLHIGKTGEQEYTIGAGPKFEDQVYCCSFDFDEAVLKAALATFPEWLSLQLDEILYTAEAPTMVQIPSNNYPITLNIEARLSPKTVENENEIFRPLVASKVWI